MFDTVSRLRHHLRHHHLRRRAHRLYSVERGAQLHEWADTDGRAFAMIHLPRTHRYLVPLTAADDGDGVDPAHLGRAEWEWHRTLSNAVSSTGGALTVHTTGAVWSVPNADAGTRSDGRRMTAVVSFSGDTRRSARHPEPQEYAETIVDRLRDVTAAAAAVGVICAPMTAGELLRTAGTVPALMRVRPSRHQQAAAFAAALGVEVSAPDHTSPPHLADG